MERFHEDQAEFDQNLRISDILREGGRKGVRDGPTADVEILSELNKSNTVAIGPYL